MNPQSLSLFAAATSAIISALPKGQLARFGLMRAPMAAAPLAFSPVAAAAGGVLAIALTIPTSRRWLISQAMAFTAKMRSRIPNRSSEVAAPEPRAATDIANRRAKPQRVKDSPVSEPAIAE